MLFSHFQGLGSFGDLTDLTLPPLAACWAALPPAESPAPPALLSAAFRPLRPRWDALFGDQKQHPEDPYMVCVCVNIYIYVKKGVSKHRDTVPQNHPFNRVFHYKPSILGYPYFWKHPCIYAYILKLYGKGRSILYQSHGSYGTEGIQSWKSLEIESLSCQFSHDIHTFLENNIAGSHLTQRNTILQPSYWHLLCNFWR